ncbi:probable LRR receptor-like serine/threonine-protein kinase At4g36180 [Phoenix dactylifera]|uniref:Probable LRR receptor-like serine/threonine-protein kinase At4g36180 n=1 Tax=Phoenix dactylifera TaxID=42345 RepID=A0A8B7CDD1_PHODC|nr:probable LRR receptor-like serine/threonine-protein kinase At4g36180 [Phoenix dactylifera]
MSIFFHLLFLWVVSLVPAGAVTAPSDVAALAAFKAAISPASISPSSCLDSWNFSSDPCRPGPSHFLCGLTCTTTGGGATATYRVFSITLDPAGYSGALTPLLSNLSLLAHLELADNAFHGPIPASLSSLSSLQTLILSSNSFSGTIPSSISKLSSLQILDLSRNSLAGLIPQFWGSMSGLRTLDLSFNRLYGNLPQTMPPNLVDLALRGNSLSGTIKRATFAPLRALEVVELAANRLEGKLEGWFFLLPSLQQVDLANNSLSGVEVGPPPPGQRLVAVDLGINRIEGQLPAALAGFPALAALSVRHNKLRGAIPSEYAGAKKGVPFGRLFLDGNFLTGTVPAGLLRSGELVGSLGDNCLRGCPPAAPLCSPPQKPKAACKQVYGVDGRPRRPHSYLDR